MLTASAGGNPTTKRLAGKTRVETSIKISEESYAQSDNVILAGFSGEADALTGTLVASAKDAPLLLVDHFKNIETELIRLKAKNVYLLGGKAVISEKIEKELETAEYNVIRLAGNNRHTTAVAVATASGTETDHVFLTNDGQSGSLADALAVGPVSGRDQLPILLTSSNKLPEATLTAINEMNIKKVTIVGGTGVISNKVKKELEDKNIDVERIAGVNRWDTAKVVAEKYFADVKKAIMTNDGKSGVFADALMGGYLGAKENAPLLLTASDTLNTLTKTYLADYTDFRYVLGGESAISEATLNEIINPIFKPPFQVTLPTVEIDYTVPLDIDKLNEEFLKYINDERARVGVGSLSYMPELQPGTDQRLNDMINENHISHTRPDGTPWYTVFDSVSCAGSMCENVAYSWTDWIPEEEILAGERTIENALAEMFFNMYYDSPGHYQNMIGAEYDSLAVATKIIPESGKIFHAMIGATRK